MQVANRLTGPLPSMAGLPSMSRFMIGYNSMNGTIPADWSMPRLLEVYSAEFNKWAPKSLPGHALPRSSHSMLMMVHVWINFNAACTKIGHAPKPRGGSADACMLHVLIFRSQQVTLACKIGMRLTRPTPQSSKGDHAGSVPCSWVAHSVLDARRAM